MDIRETVLTRHWSIAIAFAILATVGLVATVVSRWTHDVLFDTESWTQIVGPIGTDPIVVDALSERTSDAVIDWLDAENRLETLLMPALSPLAGLLATQLNQFVVEETSDFFSSDRYKNIWLGLNRTVHSAAVAIIRDEVRSTSTAGGVVAIDVTPIVQPIADGVFELLNGLGESIPDVLLNQVEFDDAIAEVVATYEREGLPARLTSVEVYSSDRLASIQRATATLDRLVWVLPFLTVLFVAGALYWAPKRRRQIGLLLALGAFGLLASWFAVNGVVARVVAGVKSDDAANVVEEVFNGITGGLEGLLIVLVILAGLGAIGVLSWTAYQTYLYRVSR